MNLQHKAGNYVNASWSMVRLRDLIYCMLGLLFTELSAHGGMAGDDNADRAFAAVYKPAVKTVFDGGRPRSPGDGERSGRHAQGHRGLPQAGERDRHVPARPEHGAGHRGAVFDFEAGLRSAIGQDETLMTNLPSACRMIAHACDAYADHIGTALPEDPGRGEPSLR